MRARQQYITHRKTLLNAGWSTDQLVVLRSRLTGQGPSGAVASIRMIAAAKVTPTQAEQLLLEDWSNPTELRHAITRLRRPETVTTTTSATTVPSQNSMAAATDRLWSRQRCDGGPAPTRHQVKALARKLDNEQARYQAPAPKGNLAMEAVEGVSVDGDIDGDGDDCDKAPTISKLDVARAALAAAHVKTSAPKFSGRADVEITFNEWGTRATVPSTTGEHTYEVSLTEEGVAHLCMCPPHVDHALRCGHMIAAEKAWRRCHRASDIQMKVRTQLVLVPKRARKNKNISSFDQGQHVGSVLAHQAA